MIKRKKPVQLRKRRIVNVSSTRRRINRSIETLKMHRRRRNFQAQNGASQSSSPACSDA
ncbi:hypothetical protein [Alkalimonas amylolytica]|uniref:Uncharacterized protein n=1 Tax=Alkalimonas amylolytica TaxID=152573 RepID=A0A1H4G1Q6_ALKAM|nr:hypothetical protein [Alkalimonas amylolytica]SEB03495.1 hypothetical protein SAMN04488051_11615 [Alkalimonas amylolytica]